MTTTNVMNAISSAKDVMKATAKVRTAANKEYSSLSFVLKQIKLAALWNKGFKDAFAAVGVTDAKELTPALLRNVAPEMCAKDKKGEKYLGIWGMTAKKDEEGNAVLDEEGNTVMIPILRRIASWTPNKVLTILAQSASFADAKKKEEEAKKNPAPTGKATPTKKGETGKATPTKKGTKGGAKKVRA